MKLKPIEEQVVVIAGASSGIGREAALRFARQGAKVVVSARGDEGLHSLVEEIRSDGGQATAVVADVARYEQVKAIADKAVAEYGRIDTWVHAAGVLLFAGFEDTTPEEFERVIQVNLLGQMYGAKAALPHLKSTGGALIHISSIEARRAFPLHSAYAASKHGIDGFIEALRLELRHEGAPVSVTQIMPAAINTPLFSKARTKVGVKPVGAPPIYQPGTVAQAILYAAQHPVREMIVGGAGKGILATQRMSPRMMDAALLRVGWWIQKTRERRSPDHPNNLQEPIRGDDRTTGDFSRWALRHSLYTWMQRHPLIKRTTLIGTAVTTAVMLAGRNEPNKR